MRGRAPTCGMLAVELRDFRSYARAEAALGPGLTSSTVPNGAGKTNLVEALYFGCTARSFAHAQRARAGALRRRGREVRPSSSGADGPHELAVGFAPGEHRSA